MKGYNPAKHCLSLRSLSMPRSTTGVEIGSLSFFPPFFFGANACVSERLAVPRSRELSEFEVLHMADH